MPRDLERVLDALLDGVAVLDGDGRVERLNTEACRLLDCSAEQAEGVPIDAILGSEHPVTRLTAGVLETGRGCIERECAIGGRGAEPLVLDLEVAPLFDEGRKATGVVLVLRDCTIRQNMEAVISEREQLSTFGRIAAGIAHEVKNPLGGIRGAAEILAARATEDKSRRAAGLIVGEVNRIAALVEDLMVFTHDRDLAFVPTNIHRVLDDVLDLLAMDPLAAGVSVERVFDPSIPDVLADPDRLTQVFLNLARNSLQAMEEDGGSLVIHTKVSFDHRFPSESGRQLPSLLVEVSDTGSGIDADALAKIATPFFTTRASGTGLGLAVSRSWVAAHGGKLRVESEPGEGTIVRVFLPLRRP